MTLKLRFKSLPYQEQAIENIATVFRGVRFNPSTYLQQNPSLNLSGSTALIRRNIESIQKKKGILQGNIEVGTNSPLNIDVWMETGTGKTFTFLETIYKLNDLHGLAKFIVLVPSNAIKQGTLKNIQVTREFFHRKYNGKHIEVFDYSFQSARNFIRNPAHVISVLVMTYQSFNKETNTIQRKNLEDNELFRKQSVMEELAALMPVIIIDEPHRFTGTQTQKFLPSFQPQIIFRFGATFSGDHKNLIYTLDSAAAFKQSLVKTITVHGVQVKGGGKHGLTYKGTRGTGKMREAIVEYHPTNKSHEEVSLAEGDSIGEKLSVDWLKYCIVEKITAKEVRLTNGSSLWLDHSADYSGLSEKKSEIMLRQTIEKHFEREEQLFKNNIKALSLIFIDSVNKYILKDSNNGSLTKAGSLAVMFEGIYKEELKKVLRKKGLDPEYRKYLERTQNNASEVHDGYFAISKQLKDQEEKINLILRDKEKLLSHDSDLRFIFSMWALQEGWDNPNIFTLCKLAPSGSLITKLQQIGRGLRLAVKQTEGGLERLTHEETTHEEFQFINKLDVIVPDEEETFVQDIQREISERSIASATNIISSKTLCDLGVCRDIKEPGSETQGELQAILLLQVLDDHKLIELDRRSGKGKIIGKETLGAVVKDTLGSAIEKAKSDGIVFDAEKLKKLFDEHFDLNIIATTQSEISSIRLKVNEELWPKFKILWEDINRDSTYEFSIDQEKLHEDIIKEINSDLEVTPILISVATTKKAESEEDASTTSSIKEKVPSSPITFYTFVKRISDGTKLSFDSVAKIIMSLDKDKFKMLKNDHDMAANRIIDVCLEKIWQHIADSLKFSIHDIREGVTSLTEIKLSSMGRRKYEFKNKEIAARSLTKEMMGFDSNIEERIIDESMLDQIDVFTKLPEVIIPIPMEGEYKPDFAYVVNKKTDNNGGTSYHLVIEAKGHDSKKTMRGVEKYKIAVARKYFCALNNFNLAASGKNKNTEIDEKKRIIYRTFFNDNILENVIEGAEEELFKEN